jgi:predicted kinase
MIVIVFGLPGSGKSYFASRLAKRLLTSYANSDMIRKEMIPARTYSDTEKISVYDEMLAQMRKVILQKKDMVLDATFYRKGIRDKFIRQARAAGGIIFIEVRADERIIRERLKGKRTGSEADFGVYTAIRRQWEPMDNPHLVLSSTDDNIENLVDIAIDYLHLKNDKRTPWPKPKNTSG